MAESKRIISFVNGHPPVGVDNCNNCLTKPVILNGREQVWSVSRNGDRVIIWMGQYQYQAVPDTGRDKVVAVRIPPGPPLAPFQWRLQRISGSAPVEIYNIMDPVTGHVWTSNSSNPKAQITLMPLENDERDQWFQFVSA